MRMFIQQMNTRCVDLYISELDRISSTDVKTKYVVPTKYKNLFHREGRLAKLSNTDMNLGTWRSSFVAWWYMVTIQREFEECDVALR